MENIIDNNFTVYVHHSGEKGLTGCALRKKLVGSRGIQTIELQTEELNVLTGLPATMQLLEEGNTLQIYRYGGQYSFQMGKTVSAMPPEEIESFDIITEATSSEFYGALVELEEQASKLDNDTKKEPLKKAYRLYGSDKYVA